MRLLHRFGRHGAAIELKDLASVADLWLGPKRLDDLYPFSEPPHTALPRHLEIGVMRLPPQSDPQDGSAVAHVVERGHLVCDMDGTVEGQDYHGNTQSDRRGDRSSVGQDHYRVETEDVVQSIFGHP